MSKQPLIIGISGKAATGKDTVADILVEEFGFKKVAFADALKEMAIKYFGLTNEECHGKKTECTRRILQGAGSMLRDQDEWYWIRKLDRKIEAILSCHPEQKIVISDVRYKNEYDAVTRKFWFGEVIRVERSNRPLIECNETHASETELDGIPDWDCVINNDLDLIALKETVRQEAIKRGWNK